MSDVTFLDERLDGAEIEWLKLEEVANFRRGTAITKEQTIPGNANDPQPSGNRPHLDLHAVISLEERHPTLRPGCGVPRLPDPIFAFPISDFSKISFPSTH
ncbi:MAG: hypothetical protein ABIT37_21455 [Luteolibacter sp.]